MCKKGDGGKKTLHTQLQLMAAFTAGACGIGVSAEFSLENGFGVTTVINLKIRSSDA